MTMDADVIFARMMRAETVRWWVTHAVVGLGVPVLVLVAVVGAAWWQLLLASIAMLAPMVWRENVMARRLREYLSATGQDVPESLRVPFLIMTPRVHIRRPDQEPKR